MIRRACLLCALSLSLVVSSQSYVPFPDSVITWSVLRGYGSFPWVPGSAGSETYIATGDSVYGTLKYRKVYRIDFAGGPLHYEGMYRQDVAAKRLYAISQGFNAEKLFYDFSANVNDTLVVFFMYPQYGPPSSTVIVAARDSILINGTYRKRMEVISAYAGPVYPREYWIEGIGSSFSPVLPGFIDIEAGMADATGPRLLCVSVAGSPTYMLPGYTTCTAKYTLAVDKLSATHINVFPNPSSGLLHFTCGQGSIITVYDALGNVELSLQCQGNKGALDLTGRPGLHVVRVTGAGGVLSQRILIEER